MPVIQPASNPVSPPVSKPTSRSRFHGCLLGGAVGDALGAPVEFMTHAEILERFGAGGITEYAPAYGGVGTITDDTQMTLFTAEGLLRAWVRGVSSYPDAVARAYLRWLHTQGIRPAWHADLILAEPGWLCQQAALHSRRAPGNTCLSALEAMMKLGEPARNGSKGCGGVMRVAPAGLFAWRHPDQRSPRHAFDLGTALAALTHGHPTGSLTGGVLAALVHELADGATLPDALRTAKACLAARPDHEETLLAIMHAEQLAGSGVAHEDAIARLGEGWVAEEALAISLYCSLVARDFRHGVVVAVNHDGDSDSTGAITGNLLGAMYGEEAIPREWLAPLELREVIAELADDLNSFPTWGVNMDSGNEASAGRIGSKYPGF
ncbi:ADP-ribosylglycohydrolase family protein [Cupriavidus sp. SK-3]|uniref:ADP-ribosylglycohydrolase family protein n=1 Tax=Cupriavidus sp. SK-3 TaxID=1470558 RepID=UPI00069013D1|nr:ADP-ribosylglycohydrolase family protein [Cupriavidus sp. SK-3]